MMVSSCWLGMGVTGPAALTAAGRGSDAVWAGPRAGRTLTGPAGRFGSAAGAAPAVSHGWPLTTGIFLRFSFSMPARYSISSGAQKLMAVPSAPARAVRPMRWT